MKNKYILETGRLILRELNIQDAKFILALVNTRDWLRFIGDKNVRSIDDAKKYILDGAMHSYKKDGFGFWAVFLKDTQVPIGICGLVKRDVLVDVDIGFALLPEYAGLGYGFECASATINYAINELDIDRVTGITDANNLPSIKLLNKIGLQFEKVLHLPKNDEVLLFSNKYLSKDQIQLDTLTSQFFELFNNKDGHTPNVKKIKTIFISQGIIINNNASNPEVYDVFSFIESREKMLTDGTFIDFSEREIIHETKIYKNVAHRFSLYEKSGKLNGELFSVKGMKTIQFVKVNKTWKISSLAWADDV